MLTLGFNIQTVEAEPTTIIVPDDYPTIQGAVNAANSGGTVYVRAGTYYERVLINEKSFSLIGENSSTTIIDSWWYGIPIEVSVAERVNITGFTVMNSGDQWRSNMIFERWPESGILLWNSDECNVSGNIITDNYYGLTVYSSWLGSWSNTVQGNLVTNNWEVGVSLLGHHETGVAYSENTIVENTIINNWWGISSYLQADNRINHNNFINNTSPPYLSGSMDIWDNGYPSGGNYWSNYTDVDLFSGPSQNESSSDGIWDHPYVIDVDNEDRYPLVKPYDVLHDIAVTDIGFHHSTVYGDIPVTTTYNGENVNFVYVDAEISNNGDVPEEVEVTFTYTIADVPTTIGVVLVDVAAGSTEIASVNLDTQGFPVGYLPIKVEATEVYNEINTLDNNLTTILVIKLVGDVDTDGDVDRYDFGAFAYAYGSHYGEPPYNVEADTDRDGDVDRYDFGIFAKNYGKTV